MRPAARHGAVVALAAVAAAGCLDPGEPTASAARVAWVAYPETVQTAETFSFEAAGPVSQNSCGRLDTVTVTVSDSAVEVTARREVFREAMCSDDRVGWYQVRALRIDRPGRYRVRSAGGRSFGTLVAADTARFTAMSARGLGTLGRGGGCVFFGPGWVGNQRPFALRGLADGLGRLAGTDTLVHVVGRLVGYSLCGGFGSRPTIRVDSARATGRTGDDWYREPTEGPSGGAAPGARTRADDDRQQGGEP